MILARTTPACSHTLHRTVTRTTGLLKLVFATETLAAGINMPARTTLIAALSRRRDGGIGSLQHNELLQARGSGGWRRVRQFVVACIHSLGYSLGGVCVQIHRLTARPPRTCWIADGGARGAARLRHCRQLCHPSGVAGLMI